VNIWSMIPSYLGILALVFTGVNYLRDRKERRTAQANKVAAWVQRSTSNDEPHTLFVKNANDLPCTNLCVWWTEGYKNPKALRLSKTFGADTDRRRKPRYIHAIGPCETVIVHSTSEPLALRTLEFRDAAGRLWVRRAGQLTELTRPSLKTRFRTWRRNRFAKRRIKAMERRGDDPVEVSEIMEASDG
jgi:hypothetical protein